MQAAAVFRTAILCAAMAASLRAQEVSAGLTGRVTDPAGGAVTAATVTARDQQRGTTWSASTNEDGIYAYPRIPSGTYSLKVEAPGFKLYTRNDIVLEVNQRGRIDVALMLGAVSESVEVSSESPLLQTETTQVSAVVSAQTLDDAPLISRNFLELTLLIPGVTTTDPASFNSGTRSDNAGRTFVNGNREQANNFMLDGADANQVSDNLAAYQPSPDAIQEMRVITQNASAEFGNFQGGVINLVIKSGTNRFHGNLFESFRNDKLNAGNWARNWSGLARTPIRWNQFGGTIGGRIRRDKLFFFADYQGFRQATPTSLSTTSVFQTPWRSGNFSNLLTPTYRNTQLYDPFTADAKGARAPFAGNQIPMSMFDPAVVKLFSDTRVFLPQTASGAANNLIYATHSKTMADQSDVKVDWRPNQQDYLTARFSAGSQDFRGANTFILLFPPFRTAPFQHGVVNWTRSFGPHLVNEARLGVNHNSLQNGTLDNGLGDYAQALGIRNGGSGLMALQGFAYAATLGNANDGLQQFFTTNVYHGIDNVTMIHGRHMIKTGGQFIRQQVNTFYAGNNGRTGYINFSGRFTAPNAVNPVPQGLLIGEADFVLGLPTDLGRGVSTGTWGHRSTVWGTYVQDDWRAANNLTLNLGIRWEYHSPWVEVADRQSNFGLYSGQLMLAGKDGNSRSLYQPFKKDFQPRIGFAYTPARMKQKAVVRGAFTISSYLEGTGTNLRMPLNPPFNSEYQALYNTPDIWVPPVRLSDGFGGLNPKDPFKGATLRLWDPFVRPANSMQWSFATEYQLPARSVLTLWYVGQHGTHLMVPQPYLQKLIVNGRPAPGPYLAGNPALLAQITQVSGTASEGNQKYNALQAHVRKRFSAGLDFQAGYTFSHGMTDAQGYYGSSGQAAGTGAYTQNMYDRKAEWGPSFFDNKHNLSGSLFYRLPVGRKQWIGSAWPGWLDRIAGGWQLSTLYSIRTGFPLTPKVTGDPSGTGSRSVRPNVNGTPSDAHQIGPGTFWLDNGTTPAGAKLYSVPPAYVFGSAGVGIVRGPGMRRLDASLSKKIAVGEKKYFQLRLAAFNVTNTPIFSSPSSMVITNAFFGQIRGSSGERNVNVVAKFYF
ncbi:MAG: carboxypeptidase regulatory-like domain-containing protein [Bryobacteraceae bacterium]